MDSINFNYFANAEPQPYQYMSYPDDVLLQPTPDANGSIPVFALHGQCLC